MCIRSALRELIVAVFVATSGLVPATSVPEHSGHLPRVPVPPPVATSAHPIVLGASPGTTGTMSLFYALKRLNVTTVHYTRLYNASDGSDETTYGAPSSGAPLPLLAPLFAAEGRPPPVKFGINLEQSIDLTFLRATEALLDTPAMELLFPLLAAFPNARVILTSRDPQKRRWPLRSGCAS